MFLVFVLSFLLLNASLSLASPQQPLASSRSCPSLPHKVNITYRRDDDKTPLAPSPLPPPHYRSDGPEIIRRLLALPPSASFRSIRNVTLQGDTFEPEGMVLLGPSRLVVSSAEYVTPTEKYANGEWRNGTDRTPGAGFGHLQVFDLSDDGAMLADASISAAGAWEYHNGGIDYDGTRIVGVLGQRRPGSSGFVYAADLEGLAVEGLVHFAGDHMGAVVVDAERERVLGMNWGARKGYVFGIGDRCEEKAAADRVVENKSYFVDYQDCKFLGRAEEEKRHEDGLMLCSGVKTLGGRERYVLGGLALVSVESMDAVWEMPVTMESARGTRMTMNPFDVALVEDGVRVFWLPDQHESVLYEYELA
ncbi:uncharacterized protein F5Z01DRAFT_672981 [Emericellopsis atlantica]|uniref:Uncharacterized protein n=1 Tax=Emericellopsis atlantica TaxID=2614577 RepID=A0A9P7ZP34_9HYPO|nr:uncharacterized protein F5Z01DRAFT_672981 [Emericellopsis atlantica]KAG9255679.1 hypothetical protein F5Z01DRAFT_672981 [Emericellopsis atlantica]